MAPPSGILWTVPTGPGETRPARRCAGRGPGPGEGRWTPALADVVAWAAGLDPGRSRRWRRWPTPWRPTTGSTSPSSPTCPARRPGAGDRRPRLPGGLVRPAVGEVSCRRCRSCWGWPTRRCSTPGYAGAGAPSHPPAVARGLVGLLLDLDGSPLPGRTARRRFGQEGGLRLLDPAVGAGAFLLAAADRLADAGAPPEDLLADGLHGTDVDPGAVAVARTALRWWAWCRMGRDPGPPDRVTVGDGLAPATAGDFDVVVGNPPFLNQLQRPTARSTTQRGALEARFGVAARGYVDTATLFLLAATEVCRTGGRVGLVQPGVVPRRCSQRGGQGRLARHARVAGLWIGRPGLFAAGVRVCAPCWSSGTIGPATWTRPAPPTRRIDSRVSKARCAAGFRSSGRRLRCASTTSGRRCHRPWGRTRRRRCLVGTAPGRRHAGCRCCACAAPACSVTSPRPLPGSGTSTTASSTTSARPRGGWASCRGRRRGGAGDGGAHRAGPLRLGAAAGTLRPALVAVPRRRPDLPGGRRSPAGG